ncbi:F-box/WD repeat-containing protein 7 (Archipelago homolog) (hAgo) (F-box and WD-40 domain-containing protein 7) (F-box protein FBX30) (SEL-10) (hCdc4), partial [Durusdinium trenchii]
PVLDLLGHRAFVRRVIADWAQQRVASCSSDGYLNVYDTRSGTAIWELPHDRCCDAMDVSFDAGLALCKPLQKPMKLWDLKTGRTVKEFAIPGHKPSWMKVNWDTQIVCTGADDKVKFWDLETGEVSKTIDCHHHLTQCLDVDWDAGLLLTGSVDAHLKLWDIETQSFMKRFLQGTRCLTRVLFH